MPSLCGKNRHAQAIFYANNIRSKEKALSPALENQGILCNWIAENYHSKRSYDVTTQSVTISTIHSVKGFDYACVFVIGLDWLDETRWTAEQAKKLTYVAITRARERLFLSHIDATDICTKCREIAR